MPTSPSWAEEVDFFGYRTPAPADYLAASGYTPVVRDHAQPPVRQPEQPVHAHQGAVPELLRRAGVRHLHLHQVRRRGADVLPDLQPARRHGQAVLHLPRPLRRSPPSRPRSTSGSSPATSAASAASSTGGQPARLRRPHRRHHDGRRLGRVPVPLERPATPSTRSSSPTSARSRATTSSTTCGSRSGTGLKVKIPAVRPHAVRVRPGLPRPPRLRRQVPVLQLHRQRVLLSHAEPSLCPWGQVSLSRFQQGMMIEVRDFTMGTLHGSSRNSINHGKHGKHENN